MTISLRIIFVVVLLSQYVGYTQCEMAVRYFGPVPKPPHGNNVTYYHLVRSVMQQMPPRCPGKIHNPGGISIKGPEWKLVFKGMAGKVHKIFDMWTDRLWNRDTESDGNFRNNSVFEAWIDGNISIKQVKFSLYNSTGGKVEIVFNGTMSTITSWFAKERLLDSPWTDLNPQSTTNYFSAIGHTAIYRRFFISKSYTGCSADYGWLIIVDLHGVCHWSTSTQSHPYPMIMYSLSTSAVIWHDVTENETVGRADYITIHIDAELDDKIW